MVTPGVVLDADPLLEHFGTDSTSNHN